MILFICLKQFKGKVLDHIFMIRIVPDSLVSLSVCLPMCEKTKEFDESWYLVG